MRGPARHPADREIVGLAIPAMGALAAEPLLGLVDTALVGRLGAVPLAALGIGAAVFSLLFVTMNFLTYGTTAEVARLRGAGDPDAASRYALQAVWIAVAIGVVVVSVLQVAAPWVIAAMGGEGDVAASATAYVRVRGLAGMSVLVVMVGHGAFRGLKDTRTPLRITVLANVVNAVLSWVLIYPAGMGVVGAAWGTVVAQTGAALMFLVLGLRAMPQPALGIDPAAMRRIVRVSRDLFLRTVSLLLSLVVTTAIAARMGTESVAGHQVARELWMLLTLALDGFAIAGQAMIGDALGRGRGAEAREIGRRLIWWGLAAGMTIGVVYYLLSGPLPRVFTNDPRVLDEIASVWWIIAALQPVGGVVFVLDGVLMGASDYRFLLWSTAGAAFGVLVPVSVLALVAGWGLPGVWAGMTGLMIVRGAALLVRFARGRWAVPDVVH